MRDTLRSIAGWAVAGAVLVAAGEVRATMLSYQLPVTSYGYLDQYSLGAGLQGPEDCAPTSSTNAMTFLQNYYPTYFTPGSLTGTTYAEWKATDELLRGPSYMDCNEGTTEANFIYGISTYITQTAGYSGVQFAGMYYSTEWDGSTHTEPSFITEGPPTVDFIYQSLLAGDAFIANLGYLSGGGHVLAVNGITWDTETGEGTLYFVDPLDPTFYDADGHPVGPTAKQTSGTISMGESGEIELVYDQYHGELPYDSGDFRDATAVIRGGLAIAVPEPGAWGLMGVGLMTFLVRWRRRGGN